LKEEERENLNRSHESCRVFCFLFCEKCVLLSLELYKMPKYGQVVIGPAGSGKSTYCNAVFEHCAVSKRSVHIVNLDPAAEHFSYPVAFDIRDLISLDDVTEEMGFGPNGGLVYCMEYLVENIDWLKDQLADYADDYIVFDCPGESAVCAVYAVCALWTIYITCVVRCVSVFLCTNSTHYK
jgi:hypothetical protein